MTEESDARKAQILLQEMLGLQHINDTTELSREINRKLESLNKVEMIALKIKLGTKANELEAGQGFHDRKPKLYLATMLIMFGMSIVSFWLLLSFNLNILLKVILWPNAIMCGILGLRTLYNLIKEKF
jgi:hypothetical protein